MAFKLTKLCMEGGGFDRKPMKLGLQAFCVVALICVCAVPFVLVETSFEKSGQFGLY